MVSLLYGTQTYPPWFTKRRGVTDEYGGRRPDERDVSGVHSHESSGALNHGAKGSAGAYIAFRARNSRGTVAVVTHVDVPPPSKDQAAALLTRLAEASRNDEGNLRYEVLQQTNRLNHFTLVETWRSRQAFDANGMSPHQREFRDKLAQMTGALYDERLYESLD